MRGPPSLSTFTLVAFYVGATVLPACAAPFSTSFEVDLQKRVSDSGVYDKVWMDTAPLPSSSEYNQSTTTFTDILNVVDESAIYAALQDAFSKLVSDGVSGVPAPGQGGTYINSYKDNAFVQLSPISLLDTKEEALLEWFSVAYPNEYDDTENFAAWAINALESANIVELCTLPYYDTLSSWGTILVQVASPGPYDNTDTTAFDAKISACLNANY